MGGNAVWLLHTGAPPREATDDALPRPAALVQLSDDSDRLGAVGTRTSDSVKAKRFVLFVGAGRHQRSAILRVRELGAGVVAVDRNADAPGFADADVAELVDFQDVEALAEVGRLHGVEGVLTVASDRAVPVVAAVAERLGLPGIGSETAHAMAHKVAMRRRLAERGVPQPQFAGATTLHDARAAARTTGYPAVLKPADSAGQRGVFRLRSEDDLDAHFHAALAASSTGEAIVETYHDGLEVNTLLVVRGGESRLVTASDRLRPAGIGFGVALAHLYPSTLFGDVLAEVERVAIEAVDALGLRDGIAYPQLLVSSSSVLIVEVAARIPGGQMVEVPRYGVGIDLVNVALLQALGEEVPDELLLPQAQQPLAIRFFTADPGPLPTGKVRSVGTLDKMLAFPGVVQADTYLALGETIRPVQVDGDRRGYVIALADTNLEALERAEAAACLLDVEVV
jgi:biotin carboxylase